MADRSQAMQKRPAWWHTLLAVVVGLVVAFVGSSFVGVVIAMTLVFQRGGGLGDLTNERALNELMMSLPVLAPTLVVTALGFIGAATIAPALARLPVGKTLGLVRAHPATFIAAPIGMLALGPTSDALVRLARAYLPSWNLGSLELLEAVTRAHPFLILFPFIALCPGFGEEIFFRGLIQRAFARPAVAIPVSAITFALIHLDPQHVIGVIPLGFYLAWAAHRTGSTWVTIAAHVANNTAALVAAQLTPAGSDEGSLNETLLIMPIGWVICGITVYVIIRCSKPEPEAQSPADVFS